MIDLDPALAIRQPVAQLQRTATAITSRGKRYPAGAEEPDLELITGPVFRAAGRSANATASVWAVKFQFDATTVAPIDELNRLALTPGPPGGAAL